MNHQPIETWILDEEPLNRQQQTELEKHLRDCQSCKTLKLSWETAKHKIKSAPAKQPSPGFSMRWQASLNERREAEARAQSRTMFIWIGCLATVSLITLGVIAMPGLSVVGVLITFFTTLITISTSVGNLVELVREIMETLPPTTLILAAIGLSTVISVYSFAWGLSVWRMSRKGVRQYEED